MKNNENVMQYKIALMEYLKGIITSVLNIGLYEIDGDDSLINIGMDSLLVFEFIDKLKKDFSQIKASVFFDNVTLNDLTEFFLSEYSNEVNSLFEGENNPITEDDTKQEKQESEISSNDDIAIIGIAGRYPQAENLDEFWENLFGGKDCITTIPSDRWDSRRVNLQGNQWGGFLKGIDEFEPEMFDTTYEKVILMDPQDRIMLQTTWNVLEDSGYPYQSLSQCGEKVGVFIGTMYGGYGQSAVGQWEQGGNSTPQSAYWMIPNRISSFYRFTGPSMVVDTACSSSLTAMHLACQSMHRHESSVAIVGGINLIIHPIQNIRLDELGQLSKKGKNLSFSENADGYVEGEGAGAFLLKPLCKAVNDGDYIYGVIKGTASNHNGQTADFMVPATKGEMEVVKNAIEAAKIPVDTLGYYEAHASGTKMGDALEFDALSRTIQEFTSRKEYCAIGTVKSNVGHLEAASGVCAVTKVLLQMKNHKIVPVINCKNMNSEINLSHSPFYINQEGKDWKEQMQLIDNCICKLPLRAGVSSFGAGGANASVILESYSNAYPKILMESKQLFVFSARTQESLLKYIVKFCDYLNSNKNEITKQVLLPHIAYTLSECRIHMKERVAVIADSLEIFIQILKDICETGLGQSSEYLYHIVESKESKSASVKDVSTIPLEEVARLWIQGVKIDFKSLWLENMKKVPLPSYSFQQLKFPIYQNFNMEPKILKKEINGSDLEIMGHISNTKPTLLGSVLCDIAIQLCNRYASKSVIILLKNITFHESIAARKEEKVLLNAKMTNELLQNQVEIYYQIHEKEQRLAATAKSEFLYKREPHYIKLPDWESIKRNDRELLYQKKKGTYSEKLEIIKDYHYEGETAWLRLSVHNCKQESAKYLLNPFVLDAAFLGRIIFCNEKEEKTIPTYIENMYFFAWDNGEEFYCKIDQTRNNDKMWQGNIELYNNYGQLCVLIEGLLCLCAEDTGKEEDIKVQSRKTETGGFNKLTEIIKQLLLEVTQLEEDKIEIDHSFIRMGVTSIELISFAETLSRKLNINIHPSMLFEYTNISRLCDLILDMGTSKQPVYTRLYLEEDKKTDKMLLEGNNNWEFNSNTIKNDNTEDIAIIGMSAIMPGAEDMDEFWEKISNCVCMITKAPKERFPSSNSKANSYKGGFMSHCGEFDAAFFEISQREAELMDPQQRLCLELTWKAIEDSGYNPESLAGTDTAVFIGVSGHDYSNIVNQSEIQSFAQALLGNAHNILTGRISYFFDLHGPSEPIDCACASALVAICRGIECIKNGTSKMAIVGGVNLLADDYLFKSFDSIGIVSKDGKCKTFDAQADGTVRGEGAGILLLKSLRQAQRDKDNIYGIIKGCSVNHDGRSSSLTAPNGRQQAEVIISANHKAKVDPSTITYIEAHGTGTKLGDPIEIEAIKRAYQVLYQEWNITFDQMKNCGIGSVKTNIGHLESAAGMAGIIKLILSMKHHKLTGMHNFKEQNPLINLENTPFFITKDTQEWVQKRDSSGNVIPYRAAVNSFGLSGVNACLILEDYSRNTPDVSNNLQEVLIILSARSEKLLHEYGSTLLKYVEMVMGRNKNWISNPETSENTEVDGRKQSSKEVTLEQISYTLQVGRKAENVRIAFVINSLEELKNKLGKFIQGEETIDNFYMQNKKTLKNELLDVLDYDLMQDLLHVILQKKNIKKLAQLWVSGLDIISWENLYQSVPTKISLPVHKFDHKYYWIKPKVKEDTDKEDIEKNEVINRDEMNKKEEMNQIVQRNRKEKINNIEEVVIEEVVSGRKEEQNLIDSGEDKKEKDNMISHITEMVVKIVSKISGMPSEDISESAELEVYGFESITLIELSNEINNLFSSDITPADFYELKNLNIFCIATYLSNHYPDNIKNF